MKLEELLVSTTPSCSPDNWSKSRLHSQTVRSFIPRGPQSFCSLINCFFRCWTCQIIIFCSCSLCLLRLETWRLSQEIYHRDKNSNLFFSVWLVLLFFVLLVYSLESFHVELQLDWGTRPQRKLAHYVNPSPHLRTKQTCCSLTCFQCCFGVFLIRLRFFTAPEREKEQFEHGNMLDHELESITFLNFFVLQEGGSRSSSEAGTW